MGVKHFLIFLVRLYRAGLAQWFGPCCRFSPSCSHYAEEALEKKGAWRGLALTLRRLLKCHPFHPGGFDPVSSEENYG